MSNPQFKQWRVSIRSMYYFLCCVAVKKWAWYNDTDPFVCAWARELIKTGLVAPGIVDERSIDDVCPDDIKDFAQCHFFSGILGWSLALRLAGVSDDFGVWTGSCPCQPFSTAGTGGGFADPRHLWPAWSWLIRECRPPVVFGEQVDAAVRHGWLDLVLAGLEACGYAVGSAVLPAASVGAPHIRNRAWFVAVAQGIEHDGSGDTRGGWGEPPDDGIMGDTKRRGREGRGITSAGAEASITPDADTSRGVVVNTTGEQVGLSRRSWQPRSTHWSDAIWLPCTDGKARPTQPGLQPLAHGVPNRVGTLRGAGNAIVAPLAAEFIKAYFECRSSRY